MAWSEDTSVYIDADQLAVAATFDGSTTVNGHFDSPYVEAGEVASEGPEFLCLASEVPSAVGKSLVVDSVTYTIRNVRPIDDGVFVYLDLEAV